MKHIKLALFIGLITFGLSAQDCSKYYALVDGAKLQYTTYNKKGKAESSIDYLVKNVSTNGSATSATMHMEIQGKKGDPLTSEYDILCDGNVVSVDFKSLLNSQMIEQYGSMDAEITGTNLDWPNDLSVGQTLPDADMHLAVSMGGAINMNIEVQTLNRKVEKEETITTPAGTFNCFVIYSDTMTKMMLGKKTFPSRIWLSEGVGMIKTESYNSNGKLIGTTELTNYSK